MPTFNHIQDAAKSQQLPIHPGEHLGPCVTCKFWQVEETRHESQTPKIALCVQPQLKDFALLVSGSSGCDKWANADNVAEDAEAYAKGGFDD